MTKKERALASHQEEQALSSLSDHQIISAGEIEENLSFAEDIASAYPPVGTVEDAAALLKMPTTSVRALCRTGQLPAFKVGNLWRITRTELVTFIQGGGDR